MKRIIGLVVLMAALSSAALAVTSDQTTRRQAGAASCPAGSGSCPMPCSNR